MTKKHTYFSVIYKILLLIYAAAIYNIPVNGEFSKFIQSFMYYTNQSNILIMIALGFGIYFEIRWLFTGEISKKYFVFHTVATVNGMFLVLAYFVIYADVNFFDDIYNSSAHLFIPLLMLLDALFTYEKGCLKIWYGFLCVIPILFYLIFTLYILYPMIDCYLYPEILHTGMMAEPATYLLILVILAIFYSLYMILWFRWGKKLQEVEK